MSYTIIRDALCIQVRVPEGFGHFYVREGINYNGGRSQHWCQLSIYSSFGNGGHLWNYMGAPAAMFFETSHKHYILEKLFGESHLEFDSETTEKQLIQEILHVRQERIMDKDWARSCYDAAKDLGSAYRTLEEFCDAYTNYDELMQWRRPSEIPFAYKLTFNAETFWDKLWPEFVRAMNEEALRPRDITN